jgi:hypothetical protein
MTSQALFESFLNYPLAGDVFVFSSFEKGIENLKKNFSAFDSLVNRNDFGTALMNKYITYSSYSSKKLENQSSFNKGEHSVKLSLLELISPQSITNKNISNSETLHLINALVTNYTQKKNNPEIYGTNY